MNAPLRTTSSSAPSNPPPQPTSSTLASLSTSSGFTASERSLEGPLTSHWLEVVMMMMVSLTMRSTMNLCVGVDQGSLS